MKQRATSKITNKPAEPARIGLRLDEPISTRFHAIVKASKRSKTSIIEECLEEVLPKLEKQYLHSQAA